MRIQAQDHQVDGQACQSLHYHGSLVNCSPQFIPHLQASITANVWSIWVELMCDNIDIELIRSAIQKTLCKCKIKSHVLANWDREGKIAVLMWNGNVNIIRHNVVAMHNYVLSSHFTHTRHIFLKCSRSLLSEAWHLPSVILIVMLTYILLLENVKSCVFAGSSGLLEPWLPCLV